MSEEQTNATETQVAETPKEEVKVEETKQQTFSQEQLDNIIKSRLEAEKSKYEKKLQEEEKAKQEIVKQEQLKEAKTKADLEKIMQERLSEKEKELANYKMQIKKEKVDNSILSIANKEKSINAQQVVSLLKDEVRYTDDGRIEVVDNNSNVRYNTKGELLTIEDRVKEFLDSNPHFRQGSLSGSGSQSAIGGKTVKPFSLQDLDLTKPEDKKAYAEYRAKRDLGAVEINLNNK
nr:Phage minor structural protein GP20 [uncultured Mediterranean phage uvMED]